jgi:hypothetical protein
MVKEAATQEKWCVYVNQAYISAQTAKRLIACARRFSGAPPSFFGPVGSASKLFELLALSWDDTQALTRSFTVTGLTLDRIGPTGQAQLRAAIRKACESADQPATAKRRGVYIAVDEEHMLCLFRQCGPKVSLALLSVAGTFADAYERNSYAEPFC